ncbi:hypothetical protein FHS18_004038 [Paenibacillus phyllosphaerae]|uniref:Uncharacterized protein n=1 Tax=Paenibacillus phyllosphaerae TaxID=274593 RepID=A0A7W5FP44_9BACL|nr:hypothetical protein [Paenibacillus phyllosphaerae]
MDLEKVKSKGGNVFRLPGESLWLSGMTVSLTVYYYYILYNDKIEKRINLYKILSDYRKSLFIIF